MKILILYDSKFGNTKRVAETIQTTLQAANHDVKIVFAPEVTKDPAEEGTVDLLLVASPTHHGSASEPIKKAVGLLQAGNWQGVATIALSTDYREAIATEEKSAVHWIEQTMAKKGARLIDLLFRIPVEAMQGPIDDQKIAQAAEEINELLKQL